MKIHLRNIDTIQTFEYEIVSKRFRTPSGARNANDTALCH